MPAPPRTTVLSSAAHEKPARGAMLFVSVSAHPFGVPFWPQTKTVGVYVARRPSAKISAGVGTLLQSMLDILPFASYIGGDTS